MVVGVVALPLSMALAIASGVPPQHGLYTAIVAGTVAALAGGSQFRKGRRLRAARASPGRRFTARPTATIALVRLLEVAGYAMHTRMFDDRATTSSSRTRLLAFCGVGLTLLGVVGYFVVVLRFGAALPQVRNDAVPNWILIEMGMVLSAFSIAAAGPGRRGLPMALTALNVLVAGAFAGLLYDFSAVPPASGPSLGIAAPSFTLLDQSRRNVSLADFRGKPLLLVFYRGHW